MKFNWVILGFFFVNFSWANEFTEYKRCLTDRIANQPKVIDIVALDKICKRESSLIAKNKKALAGKVVNEADLVEDFNPGALSRRLIHESGTQFSPYVLTPHLTNYILPVYYTSSVNREPYQILDNAFAENFKNIESKFQLSLKVPLNYADLLTEYDGLYFAFTIQSWWQVYASEISKPFRETNYRPEIFYLMPLNWRFAGGNTALAVGIEHQSNGQINGISRSWNRVYLNLLYEKQNFALSFRPWWRIEESAKQYPLDPSGDDNPDIADYFGHYELSGAYSWTHYEISAVQRLNFATGKGAIELGFTFPLFGKLRGYAQLFNGYGDSLIDYDHQQTRFGIGIALNNLL
ncbi:phospholipase [Saccharobesus litoralis]|uniref:Phospholipase A1 n=1 Tax=Saccharobesus litoralis TaxID=2172099 RepID=A0A2S0VSB2_9ALTE|nr:phospholipase A [Saccharobesus litoralis]AWB67062.1 phospholipase [Saccharobesus litoralis]